MRMQCIFTSPDGPMWATFISEDGVHYQKSGFDLMYITLVMFELVGDEIRTEKDGVVGKLDQWVEALCWSFFFTRDVDRAEAAAMSVWRHLLTVE